jgi:hypothetical protein
VIEVSLSRNLEKQRVRRKQKRKTQNAARKKRRLLQQVTAVTADTVDTTGQVFTGVLGAKARVKEGVHKSSKVAGPFRDAVVDLMIEQNYPGGTIFGAMQTIFRALGLTEHGRKEDGGTCMYARQYMTCILSLGIKVFYGVNTTQVLTTTVSIIVSMIVCCV